jgi:hypothetical protein
MISFGISKPVFGEASIAIKINSQKVFCFIAENFFANYQKWAPEVVELEALDGDKVCVGAKGRQVRQDNDSLIESVFEITEFCPDTLFILQGLSSPYTQTYLIESEERGDQSKLTFRFELRDIELFMRPFEKLIRVAIEEGAENTVEKIRDVLLTQDDYLTPQLS